MKIMKANDMAYANQLDYRSLPISASFLTPTLDTLILATKKFHTLMFIR